MYFWRLRCPREGNSTVSYRKNNAYPKSGGAYPELIRRPRAVAFRRLIRSLSGLFLACLSGCLSGRLSARGRRRGGDGSPPSPADKACSPNETGDVPHERRRFVSGGVVLSGEEGGYPGLSWGLSNAYPRPADPSCILGGIEGPWARKLVILVVLNKKLYLHTALPLLIV